MKTSLYAFRNRARTFFKASLGNVAITTALVATPVIAAAGAGVDLAGALKDKMSMQSALDSTALAVAKNSGTLSSTQVQPFAKKWFDASFKESDAASLTVTANWNASTRIATVSATAKVPTSLISIVGYSNIPISGSAKAKIEGRKWPICVMVTSPASNHVLLTTNLATIDFTDCMVQVNTQNWDAVEARNNSYIHSANGDNCFVGDIHYGDIVPAKDITCTFYDDPFANYAMPASANTCDFTNVVASVAGQTLKPGTYCGGLTVNKSATFSPGLYIMRDGDLIISGGGTNVTGDGVTFLFTGDNTPGINFNNSATINFTAARSGVGNFAGFVFYFDQATGAGCVPPRDGAQLTKPSSKSSKKGQASTACISVIDSSADVTLSGIVYMIKQQFLVQEYSRLTMNPGTLIADMIVGTTSAKFDFTGDGSATTSAEIALQKQGTGSAPVLIE